MGKFKINIPLTKKGIERAIIITEKMSDELPVLTKMVLDRSVDYLYDRAVFHIQDSTGNGGYEPTGELLAGLKKDKELHRVFNDCAHALWVEYGTGIIGEGTYPTQVPSGYQYDVNNHGEEGWTYKGNDGNYYHTTGMVAHRFMYDSIIDFNVNCKTIFSKCFDEWMGGILK